MYSVQDLPEPEAYNSKEEPWPEYHPSEYDQVLLISDGLL